MNLMIGPVWTDFTCNQSATINFHGALTVSKQNNVLIFAAEACLIPFLCFGGHIHSEDLLKNYARKTLVSDRFLNCHSVVTATLIRYNNYKLT